MPTHRRRLSDAATDLLDALVDVRQRVATARAHAHTLGLLRPAAVHTTQSRHKFPIARDMVARDFEVSAPNQVWVSDLTYLEPDRLRRRDE